MNIYKKSILVLSLGMLGISCTDLTETVYDKLPQKDFGKTPAQVATMVGPVYSSLQDICWSYYDLNISVTTDCAIAPTRGSDWYDGGMWRELAEHKWTPNSGEMNSSYSFCTKGITTVNQVLYQLDQAVEIPNKELVKSQLRGFRALYYYFLIDMYGNVPIVTDYLDVSLPKQSPRADVFDFTMKELKAIEDSVPVTPTPGNYGKVTKGMVDMLLAKMCLNAQVWRGVPMYQEAITYCDKIINDGNYMLEPDWKTNFLAHNEVSRENIFVVPYDQNSGSFQLIDETLHYNSIYTFDLKSGPWNGYCGRPDYIAKFDDADPRKAGSFLWGIQYNATTGEVLKTTSGDTLNYTISIGDYTKATQAEGARCFKYEIEKGGTDNMNNDFVVFRLSDVYLMKAEALLRSGGSQTTALDLVNAIRERAYKNNAHDLTSVNLDQVLDERAFEFAWEGPRRQDLIRYEITSGQKYWTKAWSFKPQGDAHLCLYPIPQSALDVNSNLKQNPGY